VKTIVLALAFAALLLPTHAADFGRQSVFESVEAFVAAAVAFQPATTKSDLSALFTVPELGQAEDPNTGKPIAATSIQSSVPLWSNDTAALVFVAAAPPTEATHAAVGVLFLLSRTKKSWRISDSLRFVATGKEAEVSAELTAYAGTGCQLGTGGNVPIVTVKESHGGRGYAYQISASYTFKASKLERVELK
jgi:hypothetical protein